VHRVAVGPLEVGRTELGAGERARRRPCVAVERILDEAGLVEEAGDGLAELVVSERRSAGVEPDVVELPGRGDEQPHPVGLPDARNRRGRDRRTRGGGLSGRDEGDGGGIGWDDLEDEPIVRDGVGEPRRRRVALEDEVFVEALENEL